MEALKHVPDASIDMIFCDLPYGTTACAWDTTIPLAPLWAAYDRVVKRDAAIVLTGAQPFTSTLVASNIAQFKYEWIYEKTNPKGFLNAARRPLTGHENVCIFSYGIPPYYPQKWAIPEYLRTKRKHATSKTSGECYGARELKRWDDDGSRFPTSVVGFSNRVGRSENYHPTQKPVDMVAYFIKTYSQPGDVILDNCMGSGTTMIAARDTGRRAIGIEQNQDYFVTAFKRFYANPEAAPPPRSPDPAR